MGRPSKTKIAEREAEQEAPVVEDEKAEQEAPVVIPTLEFKQSGWCEALKRSYRKGYYKPATIEEYEALKEFAK